MIMFSSLLGESDFANLVFITLSWRRPQHQQLASFKLTFLSAELKSLTQQELLGLCSSADRASSCRLVLDTLEPLSGDRKCFRMINGVLVERTVKDVVPALRTNADGLKKVLDDLVKQYKTKQDDLEKWKVSTPYQVFVWLHE
jgi:prefoldin subunit 2